MILTIISAGAALVVLNTITGKLGSVSKLATNIEHSQSEPEQILLLIHHAEGDFQESLLNAGSKKYNDYNAKISKVFLMIDTLLEEKADTSHLTALQIQKVKYWYHKKSALSDRLYSLKHSFDSLLTIYADFNKVNNGLPLNNVTDHKFERNVKVKVDTVVKAKPAEKKGFFKRIKDAIANKNDVTTVEITKKENTQIATTSDQKASSSNDRKVYLNKLKQLQRENEKLLGMQNELIVLNSHISNELENIINNVKDINYQMIDEFKVVALKNYQETTVLLNKFYLAALALIILFAILLIVFIIRLNNAELLLRAENEEEVHRAKQKINELMEKIELNEQDRSPAKMEELKSIVELAVENNPAFLVKFNEFDTSFSKKLLDIAPTLVAAEIEFCVLLRLNFETKEIARYTKSSVRSVESKKYRIRKKLNIPSTMDINIWMTQI
ncbi:helix-turn-helix transcriptional regulator [Pedobacter sp.]|uniref:helix-turn-helix transcriptional regulator n=2 Tax=Pedobacter sp. TaxID=1411316 RepID=UPI003D0D7BAC